MAAAAIPSPENALHTSEVAGLLLREFAVALDAEAVVDEVGASPAGQRVGAIPAPAVVAERTQDLDRAIPCRAPRGRVAGGPS